MDFITTFKTKASERKKVLVEIRKMKSKIDLVRYRSYLAKLPRTEGRIGQEKVDFPVTSIYIFGFQLPEIETACVKIENTYTNVATNTKVEIQSDFIEKISEDCFIVQVERITDRYQTRLDKLLSIFEQRHFTDETKIVKAHKHQPDSEEVKLTTEILHSIGTDPAERKKIEMEAEAWLNINEMFKDKGEHKKSIAKNKNIKT
jgi:hypothetical protein